MMMTCRLLCALLVLALCCCPSVCVTEGSPSLSPAQPPGAGVPGPENTSTKPSSTGLADALPGPQNSDGNGHAPSGSSRPTVTVGSKGQGAGTPGIKGKSADQPNGTPGSQRAADAANRDGQELSTAASAPDSAEPTEKAQEQATISGTGGTGSLTQAGTGQAQSGDPTSQASSAGTGGRGSPDTATLESIPKEEEGPGGSDGSGSSGGSINPNTSSSSVTGTVTAQSQKEHAPTTTTTTTTKAPTTTTTTTTEAPTTTTTRAPSRLREIDGSLSSSAWVCAPLLLAVSALAYTTLG
ncbi:putative mucin TcMUCII [Trypanosoma cruzi]|uniref:Mucin TcMUCII, putative n=2 Tax=Trypanosoma cruzi TaxID=5693 RepID=Q4DF67_TRYCC|nr:mucin TcMUCII, putative [Trypanosoma cruzi]EAN91166.1 mucin TcMUCII, putative [Trypanosoma cruzi]PWV03952.1 putative mucin TcMUCII [Trypanosoma cruzi]RNC53246.1 mucin TcMUCII [Trypanosoma cruzi]|eukprot:XP_813017.1 mucin TcMUCII [Trypanosoma cruzi strain CL Brener]